MTSFETAKPKVHPNIQDDSALKQNDQTEKEMI
jgi:hypothetical protein